MPFLATLFRIRQQRVMAILALKQLEAKVNHLLLGALGHLWSTISRCHSSGGWSARLHNFAVALRHV